MRSLDTSIAECGIRKHVLCNHERVQEVGSTRRRSFEDKPEPDRGSLEGNCRAVVDGLDAGTIKSGTCSAQWELSLATNFDQLLHFSHLVATMST